MPETPEEKERTERYLAMYRDEVCAVCGAQITYFDSTDFEGPDIIIQCFRCAAGHEFHAVFRLADVVRDEALDSPR